MSRIGELLERRDLVWLLTLQDLRVRYRASFLGFLWSLLNPLLSMAVLATVFHFIMRIRLDHYAVFLLSSLLPWSFFATSLTRCSTVIIQHGALVRRQPLPKLVFPLSVAVSNLVNLGLSLAVLLVIVGPFLGYRPAWSLLVLPISLICLVMITLGLGALLAATTVYLRDVQHLIGVLLPAWMYATPVLYPLEIPGHEPLIPEEYHFYFRLNPMYHVIQLFSRPIYWGSLPDASVLASAIACAGLVLVAGVAFFWWREDDLVFRL